MKITILFLALFVIFPLGYILLLSFFTYYRFPVLFPQNFDSSNWFFLLTNSNQTMYAMQTTLVIGICTALITVSISLYVTFKLSSLNPRFQFWGITFFSLSIFIPYSSLWISYHRLLLSTPLINSVVGVVIGHVLIATPYAMIMMLNAYNRLPRNLLEMGLTLGCKPFLAYWKIIFPLMRPAMLISFSIAFLISSTEYLSTALIGGGNVITLSMVLYPYIVNSDWNNASVLSVIFVAINAVFFLAFNGLKQKTHETQ